MFNNLIEEVKTPLDSVDYSFTFEYNPREAHQLESMNARKRIWIWNIVSRHLVELSDQAVKEPFSVEVFAGVTPQSKLICCPQISLLVSKMKIDVDATSTVHAMFGGIGLLISTTDDKPLAAYTSVVNAESDDKHLDVVSIQLNPTLRIDKVIDASDPFDVMDRLYAGDKKEVQQLMDEATLTKLKNDLMSATNHRLLDYELNSIILLVKKALEKKTTPVTPVPSPEIDKQIAAVIFKTCDDVDKVYETAVGIGVISPVENPSREHKESLFEYIKAIAAIH